MNNKPTTISEKTHVPVSLIFAAISAVMPALALFLWVAVTINDIQGTLEAMGQDIAEIRNDGTTRAAMGSWVRELKALNPDLRVPDLVD